MGNRPPKAPARLDTVAIRRRLAVSVSASKTKGWLYLKIREAQSDCTDLIGEVERLEHVLAQAAIAFAKRVVELEQQLTDERQFANNNITVPSTTT